MASPNFSDDVVDVCLLLLTCITTVKGIQKLKSQIHVNRRHDNVLNLIALRMAKTLWSFGVLAALSAIGLSIGTPKIINFPFGTNGKLIILGVPIFRHIKIFKFHENEISSHDVKIC